ncbi:hypothetical protein OHA10_06440 [Kribbella sp. NBC_00662]|uniref:hypothetical protein n=1 Tax=Kribbella sp. NBC_00662 TaxID=2975969 RepID=UPI0032520BB2
MAAKPNAKMASSHKHRDVVVDANVLAHSDNANSFYYVDALELIDWIVEQGGAVKWAMDDNGKTAPAIETSTIYAEYIGTVSPQCPALLIFQNLLSQSGRVCFADRPDQSLRNTIRKLVPRNKKDQVVLGAACGSGSRWLVSGDLNDFPDDLRDECEDLLNVRITDCSERAA